MSDEDECQNSDVTDHEDDTQFCGDRDGTSTANFGTNVLRRSGRNIVWSKPDYVNEQHDKMFVGRRGYKHFGRTKLGGDCRPNSKPKTVPKHKYVIIFNWYAALAFAQKNNRPDT